MPQLRFFKSPAATPTTAVNGRKSHICRGGFYQQPSLSGATAFSPSVRSSLASHFDFQRTYCYTYSGFLGRTDSVNELTNSAPGQVTVRVILRSRMPFTVHWFLICSVFLTVGTCWVVFLEVFETTVESRRIRVHPTSRMSRLNFANLPFYVYWNCTRFVICRKLFYSVFQLYNKFILLWSYMGHCRTGALHQAVREVILWCTFKWISKKVKLNRTSFCNETG